ncbi:DNA alkylation repair protein [Flavilitoribacter nigricans]|uniref:DNA alkylation repair protein n=1 Tax=Flavilitoribacter nigricans (strain ATCC 23147 / DSM 23189 / NBRC 102662 / NCIMB 1420 / SS-2) TaxID=1122177 RepID=A0A2D0N4V6_FLAN2|nr:DNA alkylation repair protein [Flavilitoribacter nigricans]PHN03534.1 DNA alkylation repair protein [Flavilitoribacter nigricans DSM 23189 = NBRC 102662]
MSAKKPEPTPFKLKDIYSEALISGYARLVQQIHPEFPASEFQDLVFSPEWQTLELKERMRHISSSMQQTLPQDYTEAVFIVVESAEALIREHGEKMAFEYGFLADFIERFGLDTPDLSLPALERITRWTSAEFAVRPYLRDYPERMYAQMQRWARHTSPYVRRLATEGFRPRLPWGMGIPVLKKQPELVLPVLEQLKQDPAETVRRSVANNLNDISKDHPDLVLEIADRWLGHHPDTDWIVRHACRGLLKKGHPAALELFGFNPELSTVTIYDFRHDDSVAIGRRFHFAFGLRNDGRLANMIRLEYAIDYQTLSGKISKKVFKISEFELAAGATKEFSKQQRFQDFTTRKHYPGPHSLSILVNGQEQISGSFTVRPA